MSQYDLPKFFSVHQAAKGPTHPDLVKGIQDELEKLGMRFWIKPGQTVAITAGSRGLSNLCLITETIVNYFKELKAVPLLVPAMGSHGGATEEGQLNILSGYGLTTESLGIAIEASMETVLLGKTHDGFPIHFSKTAYEADHVFVWNRVKAHTLLDGDIQSGLFKMLLVGLGKQPGAKAFHTAMLEHSMERWIDATLPVILPVGKVIGGLAVVENGLDETALIEGIPLKDWGVRERALLQQSLEWMPRLPFEEVDILIVDEMGKNISGTGMDTNVVGRKRYHERSASDERPVIKRIVVRDLTTESKGNATGIGLADFCTQRLLNKVNWPATYANALTAGIPARAKSPISFSSDKEILNAALKTIGHTEPKLAKMIWVKNTLELSELLLSESFFEVAKAHDGLEISGSLKPLDFDLSGQLPPHFRTL